MSSANDKGGLLPDAPWRLTGALMPADIRTVEVSTVYDLVREHKRLTDLSPGSEVIVSRNT